MKSSQVLDNFRTQQDELIASFALAFSNVSKDAPAVRNRLVASLAGALNNLTASAASSIVSVANGGPDSFSEAVKSYRSNLKGRVVATVADVPGGDTVQALKAEQDALIASFSSALSNVAGDKPAASQQLQASLAIALTTLTASASNAIVAVADGPREFRANAETFRSKLAKRLAALTGKY